MGTKPVWPVVWVCCAVLVGCADEYAPSVICHNANCVEPANPGDDSTMETLEASLELFDEERGRPLIDGMEIDTFWWGDEARCLMAHDLDHPDRSVDALVPVALINQVLSERAQAGIPVTRQAERFTILIELKGHVTPSKADHHSEEELALHAACGVEMAQELIAQADADDYGVEIVFMSFAPGLLQALHDDPNFASLDGQHPVRLTILQGIPRPLDSQTVPLDEFSDEIGIDLISVHPHWTSRAELEAYESRGLGLVFWMFNVVPETLHAIDYHRPAYITTSHAPTMVSWLERDRPLR
jgi:hypothetical protein